MSNVMTPVFRVSYPNVFEARMNDMSKKMEYSIVALFKKGEDLTALKKAANDALVEQWGPDKSKWPSGLKSPFRDQADRKTDGKMPVGYEEGAIFFNLKSTQRPEVVDQNVQTILDKNEFYAGCWAKASVRAYAYDMKGNRGVAFGLGNIQKVKDGEPLGSRTKATDDFQPIEGSATGETQSSSDLFG